MDSWFKFSALIFSLFFSSYYWPKLESWELLIVSIVKEKRTPVEKIKCHLCVLRELSEGSPGRLLCMSGQLNIAHNFISW